MKASALSTIASLALIGVSTVAALPHETLIGKRCNVTGGGDPGSGGGSSGSGASQFVLYADDWLNTFPTPSDLQGWTVFNLAFWLASKGPMDNAENWQQLDDATRKQIKSSYNAAGIKLVVSAFGATEQPTTEGKDPNDVANALAAFVTQYGFDGVDIDYEDLDAFDNATGGEQWLITFTQALRKQLPQGQYLLTHAPLAPWFQPGHWGGGGYLAVHKAVGDLIDWYNVQYYSQKTEYTDCVTLFTKSSSAWPQTSVFEMVASGIPIEKIVVGKPGTPHDESEGYMDPADIGKCVTQAASQGFKSGLMSWEWPGADAKWLAAARGSL